MTKTTNNNALKKMARRIIGNVFEDHHIVKISGLINDPLDLQDSDHLIIGWLVPISCDDKLLGFLRFNSKLEYDSYASFQRDPTSLEGCPDLRSWIDREYIQSLVKMRIDNVVEMSDPILTFDVNPSRIVWLVEIKTEEENNKKIFVAGNYVYLEKDE